MKWTITKRSALISKTLTCSSSWAWDYISERLLLLTCSSCWAWDYIPQTDFSYWHVPLFEHGIISLRPTSLIDMFPFLSMGLYPSDRLLLLTCSSFWAWHYIPQTDFSYWHVPLFEHGIISQTDFSYWHVPLFEHGILSQTDFSYWNVPLLEHGIIFFRPTSLIDMFLFLSMGLYPSNRLLLLTCSSFWAWDYIPQTDFSYWHVPLSEHGIISPRPTSLIDMFLFLSMGLYPSDRLLLLTYSSFRAWDYIPQTDFSYWHVPLLEHGIISLRSTSLIDMFFFFSMGLYPSDRLLLLTCSSFWAWDYIPQTDFSYWHVLLF